MYSLKNFLTKTPLQISGFIVALLNVLVLLGAIDLTGDQVSAVNIVLVLFLGLFISNTTANKAVLNEFAAAIPAVELHETHVHSPSPEEPPFITGG